MLFDLCTKRAATLGLLSLLLGACPVLVATSDLAAQSNIPADQPVPVVRQIPESAQVGGQTGDPAAPTQAGRTGTPEPSPLVELKQALAAAQATLEELSRAEAVASLRQELQVAHELNQLLASDLASAKQEHEEAKVTIDQLRNRLAAAEQRVSELEATNASLNTDLRAFQTAASNATDVARQNLKAITSRLETLTAVTSGAAKGASGPEAPTATSSEAGQGEPDGGRAILEAARPDQDFGVNDQGSAIAKAERPDQSIEEQAVGNPPVQSGFGSDLASAIESKEKLQVEALLTDLKPVVERSGLVMTVPGGPLFRANSDEIEQTSYPTLAKVAELINIYRTHQVLIVGHTDANGEAAYNQMLSKRRADLIKQFLVDNFDIDAARLVTEGKGEDAPIASNGTLAGREANRRVEVLLLN